MLRKIAHRSAHPHQVKPRKTDRESRDDVKSSYAAVENGEAITNLRKQLHCPRENDKHGGSNMCDECRVAQAVAGDVAVCQYFVPRGEITAHCREAVEGSHGESKNQL